MASDAHLHPYYLKDRQPDFNEWRLARKIRIAASAFGREEFLWNEKLAFSGQNRPGGDLSVRLCFGVHPQLPFEIKKGSLPDTLREDLEFAESLAAGGRQISAIGEAGFDLYDSGYRETEKIQEEIFNAELEIALKYELPLVLHLRRAMHKVFLYKKQLKKVPALVFHSFSGPPDEAKSILRNGLNGYFSFGAAILLNHKNAVRSVSLLPGERLLTETDAPYQPLRGKEFSSCEDIFTIMGKAFSLRNPQSADGQKTSSGGTGGIEEFEAVLDRNFDRVFGNGT